MIETISEGICFRLFPLNVHVGEDDDEDEDELL